MSCRSRRSLGSVWRRWARCRDSLDPDRPAVAHDTHGDDVSVNDARIERCFVGFSDEPCHGAREPWFAAHGDVRSGEGGRIRCSRNALALDEGGIQRHECDEQRKEGTENADSEYGCGTAVARTLSTPSHAPHFSGQLLPRSFVH